MHEMNDEAVRQGDMEKQGLALADILLAHSNKSNYDEVIRLAPGYMSQMDKPEVSSLYYDMFRWYFRAYLNKGDYDTALDLRSITKHLTIYRNRRVRKYARWCERAGE